MALNECISKIDFSSKCIELLVAEILNYAIGLGSLIVKAPQIYNIVAASSVEGLSPVAFYLDTLVSVTNSVYHYLLQYEFKTYADSVFTTVQNIILVFLLWVYEKKGKSASTLLNKISIVSFGVLLSVLFLSIPQSINDIPLLRDNISPDLKVLMRHDLRKGLQFLILPLIIISRGSQIAKNFADQSTGSLSLISNMLQFLGASARIFTTISGNGGDGALVTTNAIAAILSGTIVMQILSFESAPTLKKKKTS